MTELSWALLPQALDSDFSDENRRKCAEAARPLLQAVDELTTFASSPEFASIPAKISQKVLMLPSFHFPLLFDPEPDPSQLEVA